MAARASYAKELEASRDISAAAVTTVFSKANGPKTITTKKNNLAWLVNQITDDDVETFEVE